MKSRFCVIADKCQGNHTFTRTWRETKGNYILDSRNGLW